MAQIQQPHSNPATPPPPIIVGGCPRSGTTLLRLILDSHPSIASGPEFKLVPAVAGAFNWMHSDFAAGLRENYYVTGREMAENFGNLISGLLEPYRERSGKRRIAEKTPQNIHVFRQLAFMLPQSPFIHLIRDGRDVMASLLEQDWVDPVSGKRPPYTQDLREAARYWVQAVSDGRGFPDPARARYHELRYEELVTDPERILRLLFEFLGEPWDPTVLRFHEIEHNFPKSEVTSHGNARFTPLHSTSIGKWKTSWSATDRAAVKEIAGPLLLELGYCEDLDW